MAADFLRGSVRKIKYKNDTFFVAGLDIPGPEGKECVVVGETRGSYLQEGCRYTFYGQWQEHAQHGLRYKVKTLCLETPVDPKGLITFLVKHIDGIGEKAASRLSLAYGDALLDILADEPDRVVADGNLSEKLALQASDFISRNRAKNKTLSALYAMLSGKGFPTYFYEDAWDEFGAEAPNEIRRNPFVMLERHMSGCGFKRADRVWMELGLPWDSMTRAAYCAWNAIDEDTAGHTWVQQPALEKVVGDYLGQTVDASAAIKNAQARGLLTTRLGDNGIVMVATSDRAESEKKLSEHILRLMSAPAKLWPSPNKLRRVTNHQRDAVSAAFISPVIILNGCPGTGKSTTAGDIVTTLYRAWPNVADSLQDRIAVCAPTGKAAVRITDILKRDPYYLNLTATTIHRLLGPVPGVSGWEFTYNEENKLPYDLIVIDESSMLDCTLMEKLFGACATGTHVILVGDCNQIPPIGHGAPMRDMIDAGVPVAALTEILRNSGKIVRVCHDMVAGQPIPKCDDTSENLVIVDTKNNAETLDMISQLMRTIKARAWELEREGKRDLDPMDDVQVMAVINKNTPVSCQSLNPFIQNILNPSGATYEGIEYRVGDKIICTKNGHQIKAEFAGITGSNPSLDPENIKNYDRVKDENTDKIKTEYVANGEIGRVLAVGPRTVVADFSLGDSDEPEYIDRKIWVRAVKEDGDMEVNANFMLAYCVSCHKFQGSEVPIACLVVDDSLGAKMVASIELVYTAISRAKRKCYVIGPRQVLKNWCGRRILRNRRTHLRDLLQGPLRDILASPVNAASKETP